MNADALTAVASSAGAIGIAILVIAWVVIKRPRNPAWLVVLIVILIACLAVFGTVWPDVRDLLRSSGPMPSGSAAVKPTTITGSWVSLPRGINSRLRLGSQIAAVTNGAVPKLAISDMTLCGDEETDLIAECYDSEGIIVQDPNNPDIPIEKLGRIHGSCRYIHFEVPPYAVEAPADSDRHPAADTHAYRCRVN